MYKKDMGYKIKNLRKNVFGYSQRKVAKLLNEDVETIRMIEDGRCKNPEPQLILRIAELFDSFYMEFVRKECEDKFLMSLDWGTNDKDAIKSLKDLTMFISNIAVEEYLLKRNG